MPERSVIVSESIMFNTVFVCVIQKSNFAPGYPLDELISMALLYRTCTRKAPIFKKNDKICCSSGFEGTSCFVPVQMTHGSSRIGMYPAESRGSHQKLER